MTSRVSEKVEQQHIVTLLRSIGATVYVLGHPSPRDGRTHRGTGQTPGVPDLWAFLPAHAAQPARAIWIEVKATGGRLRPEQVEFRERCLTSGVSHLVGGLDTVIAFLVEHRWLKADNLPHYKRPSLENGAT